MHMAEKQDAGVVPFDNLGQEIRFYCSKLPDGVVFLVLLAAWASLFYFFGWTSSMAGLLEPSCAGQRPASTVRSRPSNTRSGLSANLA